MEDALSATLFVREGPWWQDWGTLLLASVPLAALSVILFRTGKRGLWLAAPWLLAAILGPGSLIGFVALPGFAVGSPKMFLMTLWGGWTNGAYASLFICLVWLAIFGMRPKRPAIEESQR